MYGGGGEPLLLYEEPTPGREWQRKVADRNRRGQRRAIARNSTLILRNGMHLGRKGKAGKKVLIKAVTRKGSKKDLYSPGKKKCEKKAYRPLAQRL